MTQDHTRQISLEMMGPLTRYKLFAFVATPKVEVQCTWSSMFNKYFQTF